MPDTTEWRGRTAPVPAHKWSKGGKHVRGATENYRTAYLMCVLYAFVIIVLAAVFLL
jgi:hypothetical protein